MRMEDLMPGCKVDIRITQLMEKEDVDAAQGIYYTSIFDVTKDSIELQMPMVGGRLQLLPKNIRYEFIFSAPMGLYKAMYEALGNMGLSKGNVLEPSCGVGNFMGLVPDSMEKIRMYIDS